MSGQCGDYSELVVMFCSGFVFSQVSVIGQVTGTIGVISSLTEGVESPANFWNAAGQTLPLRQDFFFLSVGFKSLRDIAQICFFLFSLGKRAVSCHARKYDL